MTIETKFEVNDIVWFMHENKTIEARVVLVTAQQSLGANNGKIVEINYKVYGYGTLKPMKETEVFATKQELLNSL